MIAARFAPGGTIEIAEYRPPGLAWSIDFIHCTAGLPVDLETGALVMAVVSGLYVLALLSGVVLVLSSLVRDFFALHFGTVGGEPVRWARFLLGLAAAIPLTSLLGWTGRALGGEAGPWAQAGAAALGVALVALLAAPCFAWMARATHWRGLAGPRDSFWSAHRPLAAADG
ncbi:hypothetical protein [Thioflavicoccus mobilis]|uniref:hypothetical protein n=1 Tax=Thioflavicoccus mobilis TaxID=80679 RepID=UPI0002D7000E|nr:hypothetical protein [Thioflavicoccus mobilis]